MKGLPPDYEKAKSSLELQHINQVPVYKEVKEFIKSWAQTRPSVPGYTPQPFSGGVGAKTGKRGNQVYIAGAKTKCKYFALGKCKNGDRCKYEHAGEAKGAGAGTKNRQGADGQGKKCYKCGKHGHYKRDCPNRQRGGSNKDQGGANSELITSPSSWRR